MEKRELREAHCPILKQTSKEATAPSDPATTNPAPSEERRVAFDIGDSEELDGNKERKVAFDIGDGSSDDDHCAANGGERDENRSDNDVQKHFSLTDASLFLMSSGRVFYS